MSLDRTSLARNSEGGRLVRDARIPEEGGRRRSDCAVGNLLRGERGVEHLLAREHLAFLVGTHQDQRDVLVLSQPHRVRGGVPVSVAIREDRYSHVPGGRVAQLIRVLAPEGCDVRRRVEQPHGLLRLDEGDVPDQDGQRPLARARRVGVAGSQFDCRQELSALRVLQARQLALGKQHRDRSNLVEGVPHEPHGLLAARHLVR